MTLGEGSSDTEREFCDHPGAEKNWGKMMD